MIDMTFCLTPGRSGTALLAKLLSQSPDVLALHEPEPNFVRIAREARRDHKVGQQWWLNRKLPAITDLVQQARCSHYIETSHLFGKGPAECLLDLLQMPLVVTPWGEPLKPPMLISLFRNPRSIALSFWRRNSIPARTSNGVMYLLHPELTLRNWEKLDNYQLCYWYAREMGQRIEMITRQYQRVGSVVVPILFENLIEGYDRYVSYFNPLGLTPTDESTYTRIVDERINGTPPLLLSQVPPNIDQLEKQVVEMMHSVDASTPTPRRTRVDAVILTSPELATFAQKILTIAGDQRHDNTISFNWANPTSSNRNKIAREYKLSERRADWLLLVDEDTAPTGDFMSVIDQTDADVIVFPAPVWQPGSSPTEPLLWNLQLEGDAEQFTVGRRMPSHSIDFQEIFSGGSGAMLIRRRVLEHPDMRWPFQDRFDENGIRIRGHDLDFCYRVRELGFKVVAALQHPCSHYKSLDLLHVASQFRQREKAGNDG